MAIAATITSLSSSNVHQVSASPSVRGGGGGIDNTITHHNNNINNASGGKPTKKKKRTRHDLTNRRQAIPDANQRDRIHEWNAAQLQQQQQDDEQSSSLPVLSNQPQHRQLNGIHHKKSSNNFGTYSVESAPVMDHDMIANSAGSSSPPPSPPPTPPSSPSTVSLPGTHYVPYGTAAQHTTSSSSLSHNGGSKTDDSNNNEGSGGGGSNTITTFAESATLSSTSTPDQQQPSDSTNEHQYYPIYTPDMQSGTCIANGHEPKRYHKPLLKSNFMFDTLHKCCEEWFVKEWECISGHAQVDTESGDLLKRVTSTGKLLPEYGGVPLPSLAYTYSSIP